jgi:predicted RNA-binding Zn-ribbon protein involved in translation (DUF1610 family)
MDTQLPIPDNAEYFRQCIACDYICSDERVQDWHTCDFPCPSCGKRGIWSKDVDWSTRDAALAELSQMKI